MPGFWSKAAAAIEKQAKELDEKYKLSEKAEAIDEKYKVREKVLRSRSPIP